jgi:hypothetical protein
MEGLSEDDLRKVVAGVVDALAKDTSENGFITKLATAVAKAQQKAVMDQIYRDFGKGLVGLCIHGLIIGIVGIAAWGAAHSLGLVEWHIK